MRRFWVASICTGIVLAVGVPAAQADAFGIQSLTTTVTSPQAGGHPDSITSVMFNTGKDGLPAGRDKDLIVTLPPGFLGNPQAVPECPMSDLASDSRCEPGSQVGLLTLFFQSGGPGAELPIYRVTTQPGHAASFATIALIPTVLINADVGPDGGYRLTTTLSDASAGIPLFGSQLVFWGVPADPSHDAQRYLPPPSFGQATPAGVPPKPFMIYPSDCSATNLTTTAKADSYEDPGEFVTATSVMRIDPSVDANTPVADPTGCDKLAINPWLQVAPSTPQADNPSGYEINLHMPQNDDPLGLATPPLRNASVTLPAGVSLSPSSADGLAACSDAQFGATSNAPAACPDASKIGSVELRSPLQSDPLEGAIYLGAPQLNAPYRIFLTASGPGTLIKLVGHVTADPSTGRLTTTFDETPQLPFSNLKMRFFGGPRAVLANPQTCGTFTTTSSETAWSGQTASPSTTFDITGCSSPQPFAPELVAGTTNNHAGESTTFTLQVRRHDGDQNLAGISADLPPGISADVASVPLCPEAQAAAGTCTDDSRVGTANVASGSGGHPFWLSGKVFLTGPYKGAPFGLSIVVPAVAGPLDLGTVVLRVAVDVDPADAHFHVVADALPQILQGIPLRLRTVAVTLDRPNFVVNPTSCRALSVGGVITSTAGATATVSSPFAAVGCKRLPFSPRLTAKFTGGRSQTKRGRHPGLAVTLRQSSGQAAPRRVAVTLPSSVALDAAKLSLCSRAQWLADSCPAASQVGSAKATTPILSQPLSGPIFLVSSSGLPVVGVQLNGQVKLRLEAQSAIVRNRIRTTFTTVPDVPLRSFVLAFKSNGILRANANLCARSQRAALRMIGQNGITRTSNLTISRSCKKAKKKKG